MITIAGGYLTARLGAQSAAWHDVTLGILGFAAATAATAATWTLALGPHWYPLALVATAVPCTWLGGSYATRHAQ